MAQPEILVYSTAVCPYCVQAKALLSQKGLDFEEINLTQKPQRRDEMRQRAGGRTSVPQIFIADHHIGGCDDLVALNKSGKLDAMLKELAG